MKIMKKGLLSLLVVLATVFSVNAQYYWVSDSLYPWDESGYSTWADTADYYLASFDDDTIYFVDYLKDLTNFSVKGMDSCWADNSDGARYDLSNNGDDELIVTFNPSDGQWTNFDVQFYNWVEGAPTAVSDSMGKYPQKGYFVDMDPDDDDINNGIISGEIMIDKDLEGLFTSTNGQSSSSWGTYGEGCMPFRMSVVDAHGHELNYGINAFDTIAATEFDDWASFSFDFYDGAGLYIDENAYPGDGYGTAFHSMVRPFDELNSNTNAPIVPIDYTRIAAIRFYLAPGVTGSGLDGKKVYLRNVTVGDKNNAENPHYFRPTWYGAPEEGVGISENVVLSSKKPVVAIEVLNLLGQTVEVCETFDQITKRGQVVIVKYIYEDGSFDAETAMIEE